MCLIPCLACAPSNVLAALVLSGCQLPAVTPTPVAVPTDPALVPLPTGVAGTWRPPLRTKTSGCVSVSGLPDSAYTPGVIDTRVSQANIGSTICTRGYTATVRPPSSVTGSIKRAVRAGLPTDSNVTNKFRGQSRESPWPERTWILPHASV